MAPVPTAARCRLRRQTPCASRVRTAVPGEVLNRRRYPVCMVRLNKRAGMGRDLGRIAGKAASQPADHGIVGVDIEIDSRRQVVVDAGGGQRFRQLLRCGIGETEVVTFTQHLRRDRGRKAMLFIEPCDPATFLVDRNQQWNRRQCL